MGIDDARHLLGRAGFGPTVEEIRHYAALGREQAVERLLAGARREATLAPPAWVNEPLPDRRALRDASPEERRALQEREMRRGFELRGGWLAEMIETPSPLTERMTLFWHNHFTSSQQKVRVAALMQRQNALLRRHALGNFAELLHAAARDGAMLIYLDAASNRRGQPNENFARELMELFTLGEGNYTEADVREAARAFTGWSIEPGSGEFLFRRMLHDEGGKTVLGKSGRFDGAAVLDLLLAQPATARFVGAKLWREFVSPQPRGEAEARQLEAVAVRFRASGYDIRAALRELLLSTAFWDAENRGALIKSPADLVAGTLRSLGVEFSDPLPFAMLMTGLGQNLYAPPNVRGWPGGDAWINSSTLLARRQFLERLLRADIARARGLAAMGADGRERFREALADIRFDSARWLQRTAGLPLRPLLAPLDPVNPAPDSDALQEDKNAPGVERNALRVLLLDPVSVVSGRYSNRFS